MSATANSSRNVTAIFVAVVLVISVPRAAVASIIDLLPPSLAGPGSFGSGFDQSITFRADQDFSVSSAAISYSVGQIGCDLSNGSGCGNTGGTVQFALNIYQLDPILDQRDSLVASATDQVAGIDPFHRGNTPLGDIGFPDSVWYWFEQSISADFLTGNRYEIAFEDSSIVAGAPFNGSNWKFGAPVSDYDVLGLMTVASGFNPFVTVSSDLSGLPEFDRTYGGIDGSAVVPEPSTLTLLALGLAGLGFRRVAH